MSDVFKLDFSVPPPVREPIREPIRFRHVALLLLGSFVVSSFLWLLIDASGLTHSEFARFVVLGYSFYGSVILGYHWISQEQGWIGLRARFSPVDQKILIFSAIAAAGLVGLIYSADALLRWVGVNVSDIPNSPIPPVPRAKLPIALVLICIVGPFTEELLFRGLLLDWLKQKMHVGLAVVILSVIFSLLHKNAFSRGAIGWLNFIEIFLLGLAASALAIKYRSLRPSVVMHATLNVIACIAGAVNI